MTSEDLVQLREERQPERCDPAGRWVFIGSAVWHEPRVHEEPWPGAVVRDVLGLALGPDQEAEPMAEVVGLALRRNPRRAHLPTSLVLGKHIPVEPLRVREAAQALADRAQSVLDLVPGALGAPVVVGYAENATGLCHLVADALDADYVVHSTRRAVVGAVVLAEFEEEHSHAPRHLLVPDDPGRWTPDRPLVLVDDELSTGRTVAATVRSLHRRLPRHHYLVAALADLRGPGDTAIGDAADELGVRIDVVALARATLISPPDVGAVAARQLAEGPDATAYPTAAARCAAPATVRLPLGDAAEGARHGLDRADRAALELVIPEAAAAVAEALPPDPGRLLVLGSEEFHYLPLRLAEALASRGQAVEVGATSRSPLIARDVPGYPVRSALGFAAHDTAGDAARERYAYNLGAPGAGRYDTVVLVIDDAAYTVELSGADGLLARLSTVAARVVLAVARCRAPRPAHPDGPGAAARRGPEFGTFDPDEVGWLLSDLSSRPLETPLAEREAAMGSGASHYAETLPQEPTPSPEYADLVEVTLENSAVATATAVGLLTDRLLARRDQAPVLVSLARAGTPVAVLMRRWAGAVRGVILPHYAISVVRGRGLDWAALDALSAAHEPSSLAFVDGWTGSGSILEEIRTDLARYAHHTGRAIDPTVAVLADPAHATSLYGTRQDLLLPQACLNATVCGLISRTVAHDELIAVGGYHGAKFYEELAQLDGTARFLDAISTRFPTTGEVPRREDTLAPDDSDGHGSRYLAAFARAFDVPPTQRLRAGCGETLRALLRRDPAAVHLVPGADGELDPVRRLCQERGVPVRTLPPQLAGLRSPYRCIGILHTPVPGSRRGVPGPGRP